MYMMTPRDHMSQDVPYFSGPNTSGADQNTHKHRNKLQNTQTA